MAAMSSGIAFPISTRRITYQSVSDRYFRASRVFCSFLMLSWVGIDLILDRSIFRLLDYWGVFLFMVRLWKVDGTVAGCYDRLGVRHTARRL
ncbi:hypothetical protein BK647_31120 [Pseudomonas protegens]|nr:hypothetical protein BK647_31120 [Pseudomonas protegens]